MYIEKLSLNNFRIYENLEIEFDKNINIIYGDNATRQNYYIRSNIHF